MSATSTTLVHYLLLTSLTATAVFGSLLLIDSTGMDLPADSTEMDLPTNVTKLLFPKCEVERVTKVVSYDGCEDAYVTVRACNGGCISTVGTILVPPYVTEWCSSCQATKYRSKLKKSKVKLMCNGEETVRHVYWTKILECGCVNATSSV
jgi:hypothetical protein